MYIIYPDLVIFTVGQLRLLNNSQMYIYAHRLLDPLVEECRPRLQVVHSDQFPGWSRNQVVTEMEDSFGARYIA